MYVYIYYIYIYKWLKNKANKERLQKKACERYQNLSKEKKKWKKWQYGFEPWKNLSEN